MGSIKREEGHVRVDVFRRPDGTFRFEECRRDPEDSSAWYPIGTRSGRVFRTEDEAHETARQMVARLD